MCFADQFHPDISIYAFVLFDSKFLHFYHIINSIRRIQDGNKNLLIYEINNSFLQKYYKSI